MVWQDIHLMLDRIKPADNFALRIESADLVVNASRDYPFRSQASPDTDCKADVKSRICWPLVYGFDFHAFLREDANMQTIF